MMKTNIKQHSNQISTSGLVLHLVILCLFILPLMGVFYAFIIRIIAVYFFTGAVVFIPWVTAFYGYFLGYIVYVFVLKYRQFKSPKLDLYMTLLALLEVYYFHWVFWVASVAQPLLPSFNYMGHLLLELGTVFNSIAEINIVGTWEIDDDNDLMMGAIKGVVLLLFWVVEFLLMAIYPFFVKENILKDENPKLLEK